MLVIGAGGLGSPVLLYLAAAGVGTLGVVDDDRVDQSNLQRQIVFATASQGRPKAGPPRSGCGASIHMVELVIRMSCGSTRTNARALVEGYDLVADGSDNLATRLARPRRLPRARPAAGERRRCRDWMDSSPPTRPIWAARIPACAACSTQRWATMRCPPAPRAACSAQSPAWWERCRRSRSSRSWRGSARRFPAPLLLYDAAAAHLERIASGAGRLRRLRPQRGPLSPANPAQNSSAAEGLTGMSR